MQIAYKTHKIEKACTIVSEAEKQYGVNMAEKIHLRIFQIKAAENVEYLVQYKIGRCHQLKGNREGEYSMDLIHPYRLVFKKIGDDIQIAKVISIEDYH